MNDQETHDFIDRLRKIPVRVEDGQFVRVDVNDWLLLLNEYEEVIDDMDAEYGLLPWKERQKLNR